ncbi:heavy-metal-associated domain-containing protein [Nitrospira sp. Nam74]
MVTTEGYVHVLDGRLRIRLTEVKRSAATAATVERMLRDLPGVKNAHANRMTGSVLVFFDSTVLTHQAILGKLKALDCLESAWAPRAVANSNGLLHSLSHALVRSVAEVALERMVVGLL